MPKKVGEYLIREDYILGSGDISKVFKASGPNGDVACKQIAKTQLQKSLREPDLTREVAFLKMLQDKHIMGFEDVIQTGSSVYMMLELCAGSCETLMSKGLRNNSLNKIQHVFRQLVKAVIHIHHRGIAHRNLNPGCVLLTSHNQVKLSGFSCAVGNKIDLYSFPYRPTLNYLAPEILMPKIVFSPSPDRADLWGLGAVLYFLNHGTGPFDSPNPDTLKDNVMSGRVHCTKHMDSTARQVIRGLLVKNSMNRTSLMDLCGSSYLTNSNTQLEDEMGMPIQGISKKEIDQAKGLLSEEGLERDGQEITVFNIKTEPRTGEVVGVKSRHLTSAENTAVEAVPMQFQKIESTGIGSPLTPITNDEIIYQDDCPTFSVPKKSKPLLSGGYSARRRSKPVIPILPISRHRIGIPAEG
eukprot:TRINITY_DN1631_c7_g1_i1.p1 TRINITY_DN1631_c7_g1~~TRINITY_DN1631_c7_g1_i1.p1  ORF type:complete len:430 (+),score=52.04 TRINITY_DN1631_c7_g1_i1:57-1292(+)